jgi:hypothetical protein
MPKKHQVMEFEGGQSQDDMLNMSNTVSRSKTFLRQEWQVHLNNTQYKCRSGTGFGIEFTGSSRPLQLLGQLMSKCLFDTMVLDVTHSWGTFHHVWTKPRQLELYARLAYHSESATTGDSSNDHAKELSIEVLPTQYE